VFKLEDAEPFLAAQLVGGRPRILGNRVGHLFAPHAAGDEYEGDIILFHNNGYLVIDVQLVSAHELQVIDEGLDEERVGLIVEEYAEPLYHSVAHIATGDLDGLL